MDAWKDASQGVSKGEENHILRERRGERRNRVAAKKNILVCWIPPSMHEENLLK